MPELRIALAIRRERKGREGLRALAEHEMAEVLAMRGALPLHREERAERRIRILLEPAARAIDQHQRAAAFLHEIADRLQLPAVPLRQRHFAEDDQVVGGERREVVGKLLRIVPAREAARRRGTRR